MHNLYHFYIQKNNLNLFRCQIEKDEQKICPFCFFYVLFLFVKRHQQKTTTKKAPLLGNGWFLGGRLWVTRRRGTPFFLPSFFPSNFPSTTKQKTQQTTTEQKTQQKTTFPSPFITHPFLFHSPSCLYFLLFFCVFFFFSFYMKSSYILLNKEKILF